MAEKKLITASDISEFYKIGKNLDPDVIDMAIMLAQQNDLVPVIGEGLYFDLCENTTSVNNAKLIEGENYDLDGTPVYYRGIRAQIACYAAARLMRKPENVITRAGVKQKELKDSVQVETTVENQMIRDAYSRAKKFEIQTLRYLNENINDYPLFNQTQGKQRPRKNSFRIHRIR